MKKHAILLLCFVLMLSTTLVLASCGGLGDGKTTATTTAATTTAPTTTAHQHVYSHSTVAPTCAKEGYTLHQCACGHSYQDTPVAALPHSLSSKIVRYPTTLTEGLLRSTCSECDYTESEPIAVLTTVTLPSVAEAIAASLPDGTFEISDLASLPSIALFSTYTEECDGETLFTASNEAYYALKITALTLTVDDTDIEGHFAFEIGTADLAEGKTNAEDLTTIFAIDLYMDGDALSVAVDGPDADEINLSDAFYAALAEQLDVSVDYLTELFYISGELQTYLPLAEAIANAIATEAELPTAELGIADLIALLCEDLVVTEAVGDNTVYTLDIASIVDALSAYADTTVTEAIDAAYGDGTAEALMNYITALPDMKLGDIVDSAILLSETYEIDMDLIYAFINRIVYLETEEDFDIELAVFERYDDTLADVLSELSDTSVEELKDTFATVTAMLTENTLAEWYHAACCDLTEDPHDQSTCEAFAELLANASASLDEINVTVTEDAEGNTVSYAIGCPLFEIEKDEEGARGEVYLPGLGYADFSMNSTAYAFSIVDFDDPMKKYVDITGVLDGGLVTSIDILVNGVYPITDPEEELQEDVEPEMELRPVIDATFSFVYDSDFKVFCEAVVDLPVPVQVSIGVGENIIVLAYGAKDSVEPDGAYRLTYTPDEDGYSITVSDLFADKTVFLLTYDAVSGDASIALSTPLGDFGFEKTVGQDAVVYKVTTLVDEEEILLGSLTLGQGLVLDMNTAALAGKLEITPDTESVGFTVTFTDFTFASAYADQYSTTAEDENGEEIEILVDVYSQEITVLNGSLSFVQTAPVE